MIISVPTGRKTTDGTPKRSSMRRSRADDTRNSTTERQEYYQFNWFATRTSRSVTAHKQPGLRALVEGAHARLENRNYIFHQKSILK